MGLPRLFPVIAVALASLSGAAPALAAPSLSVDPTGQLGPEGATAVVLVTVTCDPGSTNTGLSVSLAQATGNRLLQGSGFAGGFNGTPIVCDGTPQLVPVTVRPNAVSGTPLRPFKTGGAAVTATFGSSGPSGFTSLTVGPQEIRLRR